MTSRAWVLVLLAAAIALPAHAEGDAGGVGSAESHAHATSALSFTGLPPGYGVASCQGFAGEGAVPTLPSSWGRLKVRYR